MDKKQKHVTFFLDLQINFIEQATRSSLKNKPASKHTLLPPHYKPNSSKHNLLHNRPTKEEETTKKIHYMLKEWRGLYRWC